MERSAKAVLGALAANVGIALAKLVGFVVTGSSALLAETIHSVADTADQMLLLLGRRRSRQEETREHPFGFATERYFWAFMVSILLFTVGAAAAVYEGITAILHGAEVEDPRWGLAILAVAFAFDAASLRNAVRQAERGDESLWRYVRRTKEPEIPVVILEDTGAVTGVLIAAVALGLTALTGNAVYDAVGSIGVGLVLGTMALVLAREMKSLLIGEAAAPDVQRRIRAAIERDDASREVLYVRTMHLGPQSLLVEAKVRFDPRHDFRDIALAIDRMEDRIRQGVPTARIIAIEPDVPRTSDPDRPVFEEGPGGE